MNGEVYSVQSAVCSVQCAVCSVQCAVCSVQCAVSVMENHCSKVRGITNQEKLENEVQVAINGQEVQHCRGIVMEAMRVGEGGGHFIRRSINTKRYTVSKAVDTLAKKKPRVPFMLQSKLMYTINSVLVNMNNHCSQGCSTNTFFFIHWLCHLLFAG